MSRRSAPNEPLILNKPEEGIVSSPYSDHFDLRWNIPADNGETIILYHIKFCPVSWPLLGDFNNLINNFLVFQVRRVNGQWVVNPDGCNTKQLNGNEHPETSINPLDSDTHYKIELRAENSIGYSTPAEIYVKTARGEQYYRYYNACSVCGCNVTLFFLVLLRFVYCTSLLFSS